MAPKRRHGATDAAVVPGTRKRVTRSKSETGHGGRNPPVPERMDRDTAAMDGGDSGPESLKSTSVDGTAAEAETQRPQYWLMKAEPESRIEKGKDVKFSIDDLAACAEPAGWDGVRNYGARNNMQAMKKGDLAFFYHSNCKEPGIVGIMEVVQEASVDETAFDPNEPYYDHRSARDKPKWFLVHVAYRRKLVRPVGLAELKKHASGKLAEMPLLKQSRLSVSAVPADCWDFILSLEHVSPV